jgi:hypothetical protein
VRRVRSAVPTACVCDVLGCGLKNDSLTGHSLLLGADTCSLWRVSRLRRRHRSHTCAPLTPRVTAAAPHPTDQHTYVLVSFPALYQAGCVNSGLEGDDVISAGEGEAITSMERAVVAVAAHTTHTEATDAGAPVRKRRRAMDGPQSWQANAPGAHRLTPGERTRAHASVDREAHTSCMTSGDGHGTAAEPLAPALAERADASDEDDDGAVEQLVAPGGGGGPMAVNAAGQQGLGDGAHGADMGWALQRIRVLGSSAFNFIAAVTRLQGGGPTQPDGQ